MNRSARAPLALLVLAALSLSGCGRSIGDGSKRLVVETPKWWFHYLPVAVEATPRGLLVGRKAQLSVAVGSNVAGKWTMAGDKTKIRIPAAFFKVGANQVSVKTGSERSTATIVIVSFGWLATPLSLVALIVVYLVSKRRRTG